jgi:hypothetical protein
MTGASHAALTVARSRVAIHRELATTPGRLRLAAALLAIGATVFGAVAVHAADRRRQAVADVKNTQKLLVAATDLSASLSDTQATAALSISGGPDVTASRRRYAQALRSVGADVAQLAAAVTPSAGGAQVRRIVQTLPDYAGLIVDARANTRQGLPVGPAYLRRSSKRMRGALLPSARALYAIEARDLSTHYGAGAARWTVLVVVLAGCALLALLAATQVYLARATRRIVNRRLAFASVLLLALAAWILAAFASQTNRLADARRTGSEPVRLLRTARNLVSGARAGESLALAARADLEDAVAPDGGAIGFRDFLRPIGSGRPGPARGSGGLLHRAAIASGRTAAIDAIYADYRAYLTAHGRLVQQEHRGDFATAATLAAMNVSQPRGPAGAAARLTLALDREIRVAQARFHRSVSQAGSALGGLALGIPLLTVLCAVVALLGVHQRLREYR